MALSVPLDAVRRSGRSAQRGSWSARRARTSPSSTSTSSACSLVTGTAGDATTPPVPSVHRNRPPAAPYGLTSREMSTPVSALLTGQPTFAAAAASANPAASSPSTSPDTVSVIPVSRKPPAGSGPRVTSAWTSSVLGVPPRCATSLDRDIA